MIRRLFRAALLLVSFIWLVASSTRCKTVQCPASLAPAVPTITGDATVKVGEEKVYRTDADGECGVCKKDGNEYDCEKKLTYEWRFMSGGGFVDMRNTDQHFCNVKGTTAGNVTLQMKVYVRCKNDRDDNCNDITSKQVTKAITVAP